ncbi:formyltetrahydrofolate deformylase [Alkalilimnicola ehrlichii]|uniref:Formyltetrahydrofolate deformylase n=1 Tax=Alkalilimnicola ehrlichii TaxID=351052 RepID=A0A3E0WPH4_9GAMM|nr:formyltetrahydrofolate deformylase [Alkalilimnicola ehrlichii]RFA26983.1 formyltetrahydrofolate deformylase [Alkalilimnicola ehrlichii]RFA34103.1 formyltetrahydrofolate deformylase [Alkalilimnicola ehrlichii]
MQADNASTTLPSTPHSATLLIHCQDRQGLVSRITDFIARNNGNIIYLDQHVDAQKQVFFMRVEWELESFAIPAADIADQFRQELAEPLAMHWQLHFSDETPRMAVFVSKLPHCLFDILARCQSGEWNIDVPLIVSNHPDLKPIADRFGIDYYVLPITPNNKQEQEAEQRALLARYNIDFVVLARYMQILSPEFIDHYPERIINIHHSFLPAFPGAKPYHSAYARGVKIIGATSHYVTSELDAGPIIAQDVVHVSHRDSVEDLVRKGRDLEKLVLARAIWNHTQRKILSYDNRTVIFD